MTRQDLGDGQLLDPGRRPECLEVQGPEEPLVQVEVLEAHALLGDLEGRAAVSLELEIITDRLARLPMFGGQGQGLVGGVSLPEEMIQMGHTALEDGLSGAIPFVDMILLVPVPFFRHAFCRILACCLRTCFVSGTGMLMIGFRSWMTFPVL